MAGEHKEGQKPVEKKKPGWYRCLYCIFFPIILLYHSIRIYCLPCLYIYFGRCLCAICCFVCCCFRNCCYYEDKNFPPNATSIGDWHDKSPAEIDADIVWKRGDEIFNKEIAEKDQQHMSLFGGKIEAADIAQGQLGDCWLMSALACMAEFPGAIQSIFVTKEYHRRGKYTVRIYNKKAEQWNEITVDDLFPVNKKSNKPIFAAPNGNELWVLILEKAFAKYVGSYAKLSGGNAIWALQAMTGDNVANFRNQGGSWKRFDVIDYSDEESKRAIGMRETKEVHSSDDFYRILSKYNKMKAVLAASTHSGKDNKEESKRGLVQGHAYTIVDVQEVGGFKLLSLRNPWGSFEWDGDWSDKSPMWDRHGSVKAKIKPQLDADDGLFWMSWDDFSKYYRSVDICSRGAGLNDLALNVNEDKGCIGPATGCCVGCLKFWCLCRGCCYLACATKSKFETVSAH